jgi:CDP-paratose synthetase
MHLLVTGATGYLGSSVVRSLLQSGHRISLLKRQSSRMDRLASCVNGLEWFDVEDGLDMVFSDRHVDGILHFATCYGRNKETASDIFETNTAFPLRLLDMAVAHDVSFFINTDTSLDKYLNAYALSKRHFSEWGRWTAKQGQMRFLNIRLEHMYGPQDDSSKFVSYIIKSIADGQARLDLTAGEQLRDFIYIDDVVSAYTMLLGDVCSWQQAEYRECDLGSGEAVSIKVMVSKIKELIGGPTMLHFGAVSYRSGEVMFSQADNSYLIKLGWRPTTKLYDGLTQTIFNKG